MKMVVATKNNDIQRGFTLIEIIIVVSLMVVVYGVIAPQVSRITGSQAPSLMSRLGGDVRAAFDMAVLHNKNYRLVFDLGSNTYWLEELTSGKFFLKSPDSEPSIFDIALAEGNADEVFNDWFARFEEEAGESFTDPATDEEIPPTSPVLEAKMRLKDLEIPSWTKVANLEWNVRDLNPTLLFMGLQTENSPEYFSLESLGERNKVYINFFPNGYVEKAYLHIGYNDGNDKLDPEQKPYTVITLPSRGMANIEVGKLEFKLNEG